MPIRLAIGLPHSRDFTTSVEAAVAADKLGYDSVWVPEAYGSDALTVLSFIAAKTSSIGLATGVLQMPARTPANTAMSAMALDELSEGRVLLGLGVSGRQVVEGWHGVPYAKPLAMTREYVEIVRRVISREGPLEFDGTIYRIPLDPTTAPPLKSSMRPRRPEVPILLAANGPRNIALAAEIADGWLPTMYAPEFDFVITEAVEDGLSKRAADRGPFTMSTAVQVFLGSDVATCRDLARPYLALYIGGMGSRQKNIYHDIVARYGYGEAADHIQTLYLAGRQDEAAAAIPDDLVDLLALVGPPERVQDRLRVWAQSRVDRLILRTNDCGVLETLVSLVDDL